MIVRLGQVKMTSNDSRILGTMGASTPTRHPKNLSIKLIILTDVNRVNFSSEATSVKLSTQSLLWGTTPIKTSKRLTYWASTISTRDHFLSLPSLDSFQPSIGSDRHIPYSRISVIGSRPCCVTLHGQGFRAIISIPLPHFRIARGLTES